MQRLRSVIETDEFLEQCSRIEPDIRRLDEQLESVKWAVARNAEVFQEVIGNVRVIETFAMGPDDDYVFIYFTIEDDNQATLRWVERGTVVVGGEGTIAQVP